MTILTYDQLPFSKIRPPNAVVRRLWESHGLSFTISNPSVPRNGLHTFTREAALKIAILHPLILTHDYQCVCGLRSLQIIVPRLNPDDVIPVGLLPKTTSETEIESMVYTDVLLGSMVFAINAPQESIFSLCKIISESLISTMTPALAGKITACADLLGCRSATLYKWLQN